MFDAALAFNANKPNTSARRIFVLWKPNTFPAQPAGMEIRKREVFIVLDVFMPAFIL